ncbi:MAG: hypothetical protein MJ252_06345 [archaeon]|nr:hypothetical protein [archaeon]
MKPKKPAVKATGAKKTDTGQTHKKEQSTVAAKGKSTAPKEDTKAAPKHDKTVSNVKSEPKKEESKKETPSKAAPVHKTESKEDNKVHKDPSKEEHKTVHKTDSKEEHKTIHKDASKEDNKVHKDSSKEEHKKVEKKESPEKKPEAAKTEKKADPPKAEKKPEPVKTEKKVEPAKSPEKKKTETTKAAPKPQPKEAPKPVEKKPTNPPPKEEEVEPEPQLEVIPIKKAPEGLTDKEMEAKIKELEKTVAELRKQNAFLSKRNTELIKANKKAEEKNSAEGASNMEKENQRLMEKIKQLREDSDAREKQVNEIKLQMEDLKDEIAVLNEEKEILQAEKELAEEQSKDYQEKLVGLTKQNGELKAQLKAGGGAPASTTDQPTEEAPQDAGLSQQEIEEYEKTITDLMQQIQDYQATESYQKEELMKKERELRETKRGLSGLTAKDNEIENLKEKLMVAESEIGDLNAKMDSLKEAGDELESLVLKNTELEEELETVKAESKEKDKKILELTDEVNVFEELDELNKDEMRNKEEEIIKINNEKEELAREKEKLNDNEVLLIEKINILKQTTQVMKEELAKFNSNNFNVDDVLNKNLTTEAKIKSLQRQKVLENLYEIDIMKSDLRNDIIKCMIPEKLFEDGHMDLFEKLLTMQNLRKKVLSLIFSLYENEFCNEESFNKPRKENEQMDEVDADNIKKNISFYYEVLSSFAEFYSILLYIEAYLSKLSSEQILDTFSQNYFGAISYNVRNCNQVLEQMINLLKEDALTESFMSILGEMKTSNQELRKSLESFNVEDKKQDNLYEQINLILPYFLRLSYKFALNRIDIIFKKEEAAKNLISNCGILIGGYKNLKKFLTKTDEEFFHNIPYEDSNKILDNSGSIYTSLNEAKNKIFAEEINYEDYPNLIENSGKLIVVSSSALEKYLKENEDNLLRTTAKKSKMENEDFLPVKSWVDITSVLKTALNSTVKIQEELENTKNDLKQEKLNSADLTSKLDEANRSKDLMGQKLGKAEMEMGKVTRLEREMEELKVKNKKLDATIASLASENEKYSKTERQLNDKIERLQRNQGKGQNRKSAKLGAPVGVQPGATPVSMLGEAAGMINTINTLQKERKLLKAKMVKEKLTALIDDTESYMNKYIRNDLKISKDFTEKEMYGNIKNEVKDLNTDYDKIRMKLTLPKVYDISEKGYSYSEQKEKDINLLRGIKVNYCENADKIISEMFGDKAKGVTFKDVIDDDMNQTLNYFGDKRVRVGKIRVGKQMEESKNPEGEKMVVPILLTETSLALLNQTFLH